MASGEVGRKRAETNRKRQPLSGPGHWLGIIRVPSGGDSVETCSASTGLMASQARAQHDWRPLPPQDPCPVPPPSRLGRERKYVFKFPLVNESWQRSRQIKEKWYPRDVHSQEQWVRGSEARLFCFQTKHNHTQGAPSPPPSLSPCPNNANTW